MPRFSDCCDNSDHCIRRQESRRLDRLEAQENATTYQYANDRPRNERDMKAKYPGTCSDCTFNFDRGDHILYDVNRRTARHYRHSIGEGVTIVSTSDGRGGRVETRHVLHPIVERVAQRREAEIDFEGTLAENERAHSNAHRHEYGGPMSLYEHCRRESGGLTGAALDRYVNRYYGHN